MKVKQISLHFSYSISPLNEEALLVSFDNCIDKKINQKVIALQQLFASNHFKGFIETVPAYASLAVFYDFSVVKQQNVIASTVFDFVKMFTEQLLEDLNDDLPVIKGPVITIPVYYNGPDLALIAAQHGLSEEEVIQIHVSKAYRVFMVGFLPGFAYMGTVDENIATARRLSPRVTVPAGSVGIAGIQTGIYPLESPGGWQLLGQTPLKIFNKENAQPCLLQPGDEVLFAPINKETFENLYEY